MSTRTSTRGIWKSYEVNTLWYHSVLASKSNSKWQPCDFQAATWVMCHNVVEDLSWLPTAARQSWTTQIDSKVKITRIIFPQQHQWNTGKWAVNFECHSEWQEIRKKGKHMGQPVCLQAHKWLPRNMVSGPHWIMSVRTLLQSVTNEILTSQYFLHNHPAHKALLMYDKISRHWMASQVRNTALLSPDRGLQEQLQQTAIVRRNICGVQFKYLPVNFGKVRNISCHSYPVTKESPKPKA